VSESRSATPATRAETHARTIIDSLGSLAIEPDSSLLWLPAARLQKATSPAHLSPRWRPSGKSSTLRASWWTHHRQAASLLSSRRICQTSSESCPHPPQWAAQRLNLARKAGAGSRAPSQRSRSCQRAGPIEQGTHPRNDLSIDHPMPVLSPSICCPSIGCHRSIGSWTFTAISRPTAVASTDEPGSRAVLGHGSGLQPTHWRFNIPVASSHGCIIDV